MVMVMIIIVEESHDNTLALLLLLIVLLNELHLSGIDGTSSSRTNERDGIQSFHVCSFN